MLTQAVHGAPTLPSELTAAFIPCKQEKRHTLRDMCEQLMENLRTGVDMCVKAAKEEYEGGC